MADARAPEADWTEVVRAHHAKTLGLVVAASGDCLGIQRDEARLVTGRSFRPRHPRELSDLPLGTSWFVGILLCPGDTTHDLVPWAKALPKADLGRIRFYMARGVLVKDAFAAWTEAGLPELPRFRVNGFRSFHQLFALHHADRVNLDAGASLFA